MHAVDMPPPLLLARHSISIENKLTSWPKSAFITEIHSLLTRQDEITHTKKRKAYLATFRASSPTLRLTAVVTTSARLRRSVTLARPANNEINLKVLTKSAIKQKDGWI